ncbi:protein CIA1-like [Primulina huaijiensis]|uniref:protein CIA1-like n=1 Tax=Primulina huaijiensis TaxID=1492673 RepID=UPI003CC73F85
MNFKDKNFELVEIENLRGHTDKVRRVAWNPAAGVAGVPAMIASCGADKTVRIWEQNPTTGSFQCKQELERKHTSTVQQCFWSVTGKLLATSTVDGDTCVWESVGETFQHADDFEHPLKLPSNVYWNASGLLLVTCAVQKTIWIWKISSYTEMEAPSLLLTDTEDVKMVQWHPSLDILFSVGCDNTIKVWVSNSGSWTCLQTLGERDSKLKHTFQALAFNSSADKIVACSDDLTIMIWGADSEMMLNGEKNALWTHLCTLSGYHDKAIFSVHWSSEGIICSGAADGALCLFVENEDRSVDEPKYRLLLKKENTHDSNVNSVQWCTTEKRRLASASDDGTVKIWELASLP